LWPATVPPHYCNIRAETRRFECIYKTPAQGGDWIGTDLFAVHSNATKDLRNWGWYPPGWAGIRPWYWSLVKKKVVPDAIRVSG
jgi:hypothetical protein